MNQKNLHVHVCIFGYQYHYQKWISSVYRKLVKNTKTENERKVLTTVCFCLPPITPPHLSHFLQRKFWKSEPLEYGSNNVQLNKKGIMVQNVYTWFVAKQPFSFACEFWMLKNMQQQDALVHVHIHICCCSLTIHTIGTNSWISIKKIARIYIN